MKSVLLIISTVVKQFAQMGINEANPTEKIKAFISANALKVLLAITAASVVGILFATGVVLTVINFAVQYDAGLEPKFTAIVVGGLGIILASLIIFAGVVYLATANDRADKKISRSEEEEKYREGHPLEDALMLLVNDFIKEREFKRAQAHAYEKSEEMNNPHVRSSEEFETH